MDPITQKLVPGAAGFIPNTYVDDVFSVDTWLGTGTGASSPANKKITNGINMAQHGGMVLNFQRGNRSGSYGTDCYKGISDTDIGVQKRIWPLSGTNGVGDQSDAMQSFDSDGWTMGKNLYMNEGNGDGSNSSSNGAYTFRKCPGFFDMVTFTTGDGSNKQANRRISHSLKCKPGVIIVKDQGANNGDFYVFNCKQQGGGANDYMLLNHTGNWTGSSDFWGPQGNSVTSTDFGINENKPWWTANTTYSVWMWADGDDPDAAIFGKNKDAAIVKVLWGGSGQNQVTTLDWEPQMLLVKNSGSDWAWYDYLRGSGAQVSGNSISQYNGVAMFSSNDDEESNGYGISFNQEGFFNSTYGGDMFVLAIRRPDGDCGKFAESPSECLHIHKGAEPDTENFNLNTVVDSSNNQTGFGIHDMEFSARRYGSASTTYWYNTNRMMSGSSNNNGGSGTSDGDAGFSRWYLSTTNDAYLSQQEASLRNIRYDLNSEQLTASPPIRGAYIPPNGWGNNSGGAGQDSIFYMFKRKPGFFDMIKYVGYESVPTSHKLGVSPDLVIVKSLTNNSSSSYGNYWGVWSKAAVDANVSTYWQNYHAWLNHVNSVQAQSYALWTAMPTATSLNIATGHPNDSSVTHMMYLFANCPGVSKFGLYSGLGSGNSVDVTDVGFSPRLLIIKDLTTSGGQDYWFVFDTKRGLSSDNDPYLILNEQNTEVTGTDYVDPLSNGFQITNTATDNFNRSGDKYLYLAFA